MSFPVFRQPSSSRSLPSASLAALLVFLLPAAQPLAIPLDVNSRLNRPDDSPGDGQCSTGQIVDDPIRGLVPECTLLAAVEESNAWPGRDTIRFGSPLLYDATGHADFALLERLPSLVDAVDVDGTTAPEFVAGEPPRILVRNASLVGPFAGLTLMGDTDGSRIRGLGFQNFSAGVQVFDASDVWIDACSFGLHTLPGGEEIVVPNTYGISIVNGAKNVRIGMRIVDGTVEGQGNVISGNEVGILLGGYSRHATVLGNRIGTDHTGTRITSRPDEHGTTFALGNTTDGIQINSPAGTVIGTVLESPDPNATPRFVALGNVIAGNLGDGIRIDEWPNALGEGPFVVAANAIGVARSGTHALGNGGSGIAIDRLFAQARIGGGRFFANMIGANGGDGIEITSGEAGPIEIESNRIGAGAAGEPLGNLRAGIAARSPLGALRIGAPGRGNVIGWNASHGVVILESADPRELAGNTIGVDATGEAIPNSGHGLRILTDPTAAAMPVVVGSGVATPDPELASRANRIAHNLLDAISIEAPADATIRANEIADNGLLAIDLDENGVTPNDAGDPDVGANGRQNSPDPSTGRTRFDWDSGELVSAYRVDSSPANARYPLTIDFYLSDASARQPAVHLGTDVYPAANARLERIARFQPRAAIPLGTPRIVAMATDADGRTSEVGSAIVVPESRAGASLVAGIVLVARLAGRRREARRRGAGAALRPASQPGSR